jgi:anti-anti-sigma factor
MAELKIERVAMGDMWLALNVVGEVDLATVDQLTTELDAAFEDGSTNVLVDLTGTSFMDSTGLKTLVMAQRRYQDDGRSFAIQVDGGPVSRLIDLSGLESSITVVKDRSELSG